MTYPVISAYCVRLLSAIVTLSCVDNAKVVYAGCCKPRSGLNASVVPDPSASTSHNPFLVSTTTGLSHPPLTVWPD
jgi:hypothetical protein